MIRLFTVFAVVLGSVSRAGELVTSQDASTNSSRPTFTARTYYQLRSAEPPGQADWPEGLTFEEGKLLSVDEFTSLLDGSWIVLSHCEGAPVTVQQAKNDGVLDGVNRDAVQYEFAGDTATRRLKPPASVGKHVPVRIESGPLNTKALDHNEFLLSIGGDVQLPPSIFQYRRIKETGEAVVLSVEGSPSTRKPCINGQHTQAVFIQIPTS